MTTSNTILEKAAYTRREAAELFGVSEAAIRLWESQGRLHSLRFGKLRRIPASEIDRVLRYGLDAEGGQQ
jgi:excisionase family DNA binding protein